MAVKSDKPELNLDEDLFDFPVMEMTVEGVREVKPEEIAAAVAAATAKPAAASSPSAPAAPAPTATTDDVAAVAKAAALVDHLERVAPELLEAPVARGTSAPTAGTRRDPRVLALVGLALGVNLCLAVLAWRATDSVGAGVQDMREELARNAERIAQQNERIAELARQRAAAAPTVATTGTQTSALDNVAPALEAYEDTALRLAQREIELGRHNDARVRLQRLLARIDAVDAARRAEVEAQASFLVAQSLQAQADLKRSKAQ